VGSLQALASFALKFLQLLKKSDGQSVAAGVSPANFRATGTVATTERASALRTPKFRDQAAQATLNDYDHE